MRKRGFTMIELLIVMAILGILAIALLAAINPIEQINRGRDTGGRSDTEQLAAAIDRYYTTVGWYPWQTASDDSILVDWVAVNDLWTDGTTPVTTKLVDNGEIKSQFEDKIKDNFFAYHADDTDASTYICFEPTSTAFKNEAETRCLGTLPADFPASACNNALGQCGTAPDDDCICLP